MLGRDMIVIGASAGGVTALRTLLPLLPHDLPAALFLALHRRSSNADMSPLLAVLSRLGRLKIEIAEDGRPIHCSHIYIAPADSHVLVERGLIRVERSPAESRFRPSVDVLFRSAARSYGRRVIGVVLSGMLNDGTAGLWQIWKRGGITIVQDPSEASYADMPKSALANVPVDHSLALVEIAKKLVALTQEPPTASPINGSRSARVFIVEAEPVVAMNLESRLSALGYNVVGSVSSGGEALQAVPAAAPDLVLMDAGLDGNMSGTEAARRLWEQYQIPVVYLTAYADEKTLDAVKTSNPYGYIVKPYHPEQIRAALQLALDRYEREVLIDQSPPLKQTDGKEIDT